MTEKSTENNIIIFPDVRELREEIEKLKVELSMVLIERDELKLVKCRNIETAYLLSFGALEYKSYELECQYLRLRRKAEMIQAKKNRQEKIILPEIDELLDSEFSEYQEGLNERLEQMNEAIDRSKMRSLSKEESKELKSLYRKIVKALHPDLNPDQSQAEHELFVSAVEAYKQGDLHTLSIIELMKGEPEIPKQHKDALKHLKDEKSRMEGVIQAIHEEIAQIKEEYPYVLSAILDDEDRCIKKKADLESLIEDYREAIKMFNEKIEDMLR